MSQIGLLQFRAAGTSPRLVPIPPILAAHQWKPFKRSKSPTDTRVVSAVFRQNLPDLTSRWYRSSIIDTSECDDDDDTEDEETWRERKLGTNKIVGLARYIPR